MDKVEGYKTPIWAQAAMGLAGVGVLLSLIAVVTAYIGLQLNKFDEAEVWLLAYFSIALFIWAVPLGALGAILAEIRKHRLSWSQKNGMDADIQLGQSDQSSNRAPSA